ncbi:hypothetical protein SEA_TFORTROY_60 [Arthrobacter phage TforTroy]|uniref:HNH endonuclease n=1 Tax=Arthrobacter phage TforTroy TaxID=3118973 RepID=A0ABZ2CMN0_9CAUD
MSALVWTSNFSSGSNTAKCKACDWTGNRHESGAYGYGKAKAEADAHDAEHHAPTYKLVGENTITGNFWTCEEGMTRREADLARDSYARLEGDYKIAYHVEEETLA